MFRHLPWLRKFADQRSIPIIPVLAKNIEFLSGPSHFYNFLLNSIRESKIRIGLSALYLGTGPKEIQLVDALSEKLSTNSALEAIILLDQHRARRVNEDGQSSTSLLKSLESIVNFRLALIGTANELPLLSRFHRLNEIRSIYHSKFGIFDRNVLITGANLSEIYFEKRQDRYMVIRDTDYISNYVQDLAQTLSSDSSFATRIRELNSKHKQFSDRAIDQDVLQDTYVIPLLQFKKFCVTDTDNFLSSLSYNSRDAEVHLSTGYFNPGEIINSINFKSLLAPSGRANGFYAGRGVLSKVPEMYASIYRSYLQEHSRTQLYLYERDGWSFHAKGIWIKYPQGLYMHIIGSSNFNVRSSERDLEFQLVLLTSNTDLINMLEGEREQLWSSSRRSCIQDFPPSISHKAILPLVRTFL